MSGMSKKKTENIVNIDEIDTNLSDILKGTQEDLQKEIEEIARAKEENQLERRIEQLQQEIKKIQEFIATQGYDKELEKIQKKIEEIDEAIQSQTTLKGKPTLIDFWAEWCGPCRNIAPTVHQLKEKHKDTLNVLQINTETAVGNKLFKTYAEPFKVDGIPYLILFDKNGALVNRLVGAYPDKLVQMVEAVLKA